MKIERIILLSCAFGFALIGLTAMLSLSSLTDILGLTLNSKLAGNDLAAVYGGMHLGLSAFFAVALNKQEWNQPGLLLGALSLGGLAIARLVNFGTSGFPEALGVIFFILEAVSALAIVLVYRAKYA